MVDESPFLTETPLPDNQFSLMERGAATLILTAIILLLGAIAGQEIAPGNGAARVWGGSSQVLGRSIQKILKLRTNLKI